LELLFFVDERLPKALTDRFEELANEVSIIYKNASVIYAGSTPISGISGSYFTNAGSIIRTTAEYGTQRDAGRMIGKIFEKLRRDGRRVVFFTTSDITRYSGDSGYLNFVFGCTDPTGIVISMARFKQYPLETQMIILSGLVMHEIGHVFNVAGDTMRANTVYNIGMHCTDECCVMQQGLTAEQIRKNFSRTWKAHGKSRDLAGRYYCTLCREDIDRATSVRPLMPKRKATTTVRPPMPKRKATTTVPAPMPKRKTTTTVPAQLPPRRAEH